MELKIKPRFFAKGVGKICCAMSKDRGLIIWDVSCERPMRRNSVLVGFRVR